MNPTYLQLNHCIGMISGQHEHHYTRRLLEEIPDSARAIAIHAPDNGAGKSTLMKFGLVPWRNPLDANGKPIDCYSEFLDGGSRVGEFSHDGDAYQWEIHYSIKGKTRSQKAFLYRNGQPYVTRDGLKSTGTSGTYDRCLEDLLGPRALYYTAAYRTQNCRKLAEYSDAKSLLSDLLSLGSIEELRDAAKDRRRGELRKFDDSRRELPILAELEDNLNGYEKSLRSLATSLDDSKKTVFRSTKNLIEARVNLEKSKSAEGVAKQANDIQRRINGEKSKFGATIRGFQSRIVQERVSDFRDMVSIKNRIDAEENLLVQEPKILAAREELHELAQLKIDITSEIGNWDSKKIKYDDFRQQLKDTAAEYLRLTDIHKLAIAAIDTAEKSVALILDLPFGNRCADSGCGYVAIAAKEKKLLPQHKFDAEKKKKAIEQLESKRKNLSILLAAIEYDGVKHRDAVIENIRIDNETARKHLVADRYNQLDMAKLRMEKAITELIDAEQHNKRIKEKSATAIARLEQEIADTSEQHDAQIVDLYAQRHEIMATIIGIADVTGAQEVVDLREYSLANAESKRDKLAKKEVIIAMKSNR